MTFSWEIQGTTFSKTIFTGFPLIDTSADSAFTKYDFRKNVKFMSPPLIEKHIFWSSYGILFELVRYSISNCYTGPWLPKNWPEIQKPKRPPYLLFINDWSIFHIIWKKMKQGDHEDTRKTLWYGDSIKFV